MAAGILNAISSPEASRPRSVYIVLDLTIYLELLSVDPEFDLQNSARYNLGHRRRLRASVVKSRNRFDGGVALYLDILADTGGRRMRC